MGMGMAQGGLFARIGQPPPRILAQKGVQGVASFFVPHQGLFEQNDHIGPIGAGNGLGGW